MLNTQAANLVLDLSDDQAGPNGFSEAGTLVDLDTGQTKMRYGVFG